MELDLKGKVAVITGASLGIGQAVAEGLAQEGVHLALCARDETRIVQTAKAIHDKYGVRAIGVRADASKADDLAHFVAEIEKEFGGADILINNAGTGGDETIMNASDDRWYYFLDLHLMAAVRLARSLVPFMRHRGGGVILNNGSICATQPSPYEPIYNTTKAALAMFTKCLSNELIGDNIRVNLINPGLIDTPDWHKTAGLLTKGTEMTPEQFLEKTAKENAPIGRFATAEELAHFFVFMCSPRASYCVGSSYYVDGGWLRVVT